MKKYDLHVHAMLTRSIPFKMADLRPMVAQARKRKLNGFALTEHIDAPGYWTTYDLLRETYPYRDGVYEIEPGFHIINGVEISLMHGGDLIALGDPENIRKLDKRFGLNRGQRPPLPDIIRNAGDDLILIGAHPYRPAGGLMKFDACWLKELTALEINGKDYGLEHDVRKTAADLGLPVVGGSDAHYWPQIGISLTSIPLERPDITMLKEAISHGFCMAERSQDAAEVVEMCNSYKRMIKEELGIPTSANKVRQLSLNLL